MRIFLALAVVVSHNHFAAATSGYLAVLAFFVISGFFMAMVLNERYAGRTGTFYAARFLRLWPAYITVLVLTAIFIRPITLYYGSWVAQAYSYFVLITMWPYETLYWFGFNGFGETAFLSGVGTNANFSPAIFHTNLSPMWSVGIELSFYMVAPLFARSWRATAILCAAAYVVHLALTAMLPPTHVLVVRSAFNVFWLFLLGMLAYHLWIYAKPVLDSRRVNSLLAASMAVGTAALCIWAAQSTYRGHVWEGSAWLIGDAPFLIFAVAIIPIFHYTRASRFDRLVGELSYPLYLVHWPLTSLALNTHRDDWRWTVAIIAISLTCAAVLHFVVERPVDRLRRRLTEYVPMATQAALKS